MNPQVLTITRSDCCASGTSAYPSWASSPSIRSESTRFLEQPRLTKLTVPLGFVFAPAVMHRSVVLPGNGCLERLGGLPGVEDEAKSR